MARQGTKTSRRQRSSAASPDQVSKRFWRKGWVLCLILLAVTLLAYQPAWNGKPIWDDDAHITRPDLRSLDGLKRIWIQPGATQQYYPILFTAFWLEHKLLGDAPPGYHLVNVALHAGCAIILGFILVRLGVSGAWLAAAIFALHPVEVESVAWIAELKNTLSGLFYLSAALLYLRFDRTREQTIYGLALGLFLLGLASKTVIATLPAALLVILWWKRGHLSWKRDGLPLLPFFIAGAGAGLFTAWMEHGFVGARGSEFAFTPIERFLIAGRSFWFYLGKLFWPVDLAFVYPRWHISQQVWWQYLFPLAALLLAIGLWQRRQRWRGPWAAFLFFAGTLFPVLGFLNVYPFRYSFVADHFQYLASIGPITLLAAGVSNGFARIEPKVPWLRKSLCGLLLLTLFALTWRQCFMYADLETLWRTTLSRSPDSWLAHNNFGTLLLQKGRTDEAGDHFQKALELNPAYPEAHNNLGNRLRQAGRLTESLAHLEEAVRIDPNYAEAHNNLGNTLLRLGKRSEAVAHFDTALRLDPAYAGAHNNLGNALLELGRKEEAATQFQKALEIDPAFSAAHYNFGNHLMQSGKPDEAIVHFVKVLELDPGNAAAHTNLGAALQLLGRGDEALLYLQKAVELNPASAEARNNLGNTLLQLGRIEEALTHLRRAIELDPRNVNALNNTAWVLATSSLRSARDGPKAVELAQRADEITQGANPVIRATLAAAFAESGRLPEAITTAENALKLATVSGQVPLAEAIRAQLKSYTLGSPLPAKP